MNVAELCGLPSESRAIRAIRLRGANYKTTLSANSLETATDSSNSLPSTIQSVSFGTYRRIAGKARVCAGLRAHVGGIASASSSSAACHARSCTSHPGRWQTAKDAGLQRAAVALPVRRPFRTTREGQRQGQGRRVGGLRVAQLHGADSARGQLRRNHSGTVNRLAKPMTIRSNSSRFRTAPTTSIAPK